MISRLKKLIPEPLLLAYHKAAAYAAALWYGFPARKLAIVGITGTKGKTSTANYVWSALSAAGWKAGLISTAGFRIGAHEEPNAYHMTMPGPFIIQKRLRDMLRKGVEVVAMEFTSEGMKQYRHTGIPADIAIFTNLTPEHLGSHRNDFETYKRAKAPLFRDALQHKNKTVHGKRIPRVNIVNTDSEHSTYYAQFPAEEHLSFGIASGDIRAEQIESGAHGTKFKVGETSVQLAIPGIFNMYNALGAFSAARALGVPDEITARGLSNLAVIPGRMERIDEGQNFTVIVDYAHEPASLGALLSAAEAMKASPDKKIVLLTGVIGGGRESRVPLAELGAEKADCLILTNEDPYEKDPAVLIEELAKAAEAKGKSRGENLFPILDRKEAIRKALSLAEEGAIVLIAGKGAEKTMMTARGPVPWDERAIVRNLVKEYLTH